MMEVLLKNQLSLTLQVRMLVKNTHIIFNFLRQVWVCLFQDPKTSKVCLTNSLLPFGYYLRN